jgi:type II secretory pathway predicted ATPase ExeA
MLTRAEAHALAQRLVHVATLRLLSREEVHAYVQHRCRMAGATSDIFDTEAHEALFEISSGNLRAIDHLALKAIEACARTGAGAVSSKEIIEARQSLCV